MDEFGGRMRLRRRLALERNSLRRTSDRTLIAVTSLLILVAVLGAPLAGIAAGTATDRQETRTEHSIVQRATRVSATLTGRVRAVSSGGLWSEAAAEATARWTAPNGAEHTGTINVSDKAVPGDHVAIWVDPTGQISAAPRTRLLIIEDASLTAVGTAMGCVLILWLSQALFVAALNQVHMRHWARDWATADRTSGGRGSKPKHGSPQGEETP